MVYNPAMEHKRLTPFPETAAEITSTIIGGRMPRLIVENYLEAKNKEKALKKIRPSWFVEPKQSKIKVKSREQVRQQDKRAKKLYHTVYAPMAVELRSAITRGVQETAIWEGWRGQKEQEKLIQTITHKGDSIDSP